MRIGIVTIHKSMVNYGACLQCYALWKYLQQGGHEVEVIDLLRPVQNGYKFCCDKNGLRQFYRLKIIANIRHSINILRSKAYRTRIKNYNDFNNLISYSKTYRNHEEITKQPPVYDIYLSGSDQIWNPYMPFNNLPYLLSFVSSDKQKIAYASSFAVNNIPSECIETYKTLLSQYTSLSTRENGGRDIVYTLLNKKIPVVLDPVFLLSKDAWDNVRDKAYCVNENYVLLYSLHLNQELINLGKRIANEMQCKLYIVTAGFYKYKSLNGMEYLTDVGPAQWLNLICNTKLFLTNSFHGTAFAILLKKPFISCIDKKAKMNDRIFTLLHKLGYEDHLLDVECITDENNILLKKAHSFTIDNEVLLRKEIEMSINYLNKAIN